MSRRRIIRATAVSHRSFWQSFARNEDGTILFFGVYVLLIMLMVGGIGIDLMHFERDRSQLQYTLDRAVLAAADLEQPLDPEEVVNDYFAKAGLSQYLTAVHVTGDKYQRQVKADVSASVITQFMHMTGWDTLSANLSATAAEQVPDVEISLVLDISGSMKTNQRVDLMKPAAKSFISTVLERNTGTNPELGDAEYLTSINVVPFAGHTNPGEKMFEYLGGERFGTTGSDYFPEWQQDISNIVFWYDLDGDGVEDYSVKIDNYPDNDVSLFNKDDLDTYLPYALDFIERNSPVARQEHATLLGASIKGGKVETQFFDVTGTDVLGSTKFNQTDEVYDFNTFYNGIVPNNESSCIEMEYEDFFDTSLPDASIDQVAHFVNWDYDEVTQNWGWCPGDDMSIQYAQRDETKLHGYIDSLRLFDGTGTNYGMKYALALLDPTTQPAFEYLVTHGEVPADFTNRPLAWDAEQSSKYIVLMTDGRTGTQVRPSDTLDPVNDSTELTERPSTETVLTSGQLTNLQLFHEQCELAKSKGVTIYTVAFETSDKAAAEVKECASSPAHFFEVTGQEVIGTFVAIASSIQRLRLVD